MEVVTHTELAPIRSPGGTASPLATWQTGHPWRWAVAIGLGGTVLTAFGAAVSQIQQLGQPASTYTQTLFVGLSALAGLVIMWRTGPSLTDYGLRRPRRLADTLWLVPMAALPVILLAATGITVSPGQVLAYGALAVAVGLSEEIWFRGLLLSALRGLGRRRAVIGASVVFGVLHLMNLFAGGDRLYVVLQFAFACLAGFVLAELVEVTGSLWIGIGWHVVYDAVALSAGDALTPYVMAGAAAMTAVLAGYAVWLWRRLPDHDTDAQG